MSTQLTLLPVPEPKLRFDGATYSAKRDFSRLASQLDRVRELMRDGEWRDLETIRIRCGGTTASVSSRIRDLRKIRFGGHTVERRYIADGWWEYRMLVGGSQESAE